MDVTVVSRTDVGRVRTNNEDNFMADGNLGLFVVCDGMGGHNAGEVASKLCIEAVAKELEGALPLRTKYQQSGKPADLKALRKAMETALSNACKEIFKQATRSPDQSGMGTTCTAVLMASSEKGVMGHVGDSRLYVVRNGKAHQLSEDHTYVNELIKRGALSQDQARNHPQGNVLSRAMGVQPQVNVDTMVFDMDPGDTYLLCSDGLYNYFPNASELIAPLQLPEMNKGLNFIIDKALERGGHDNTTGVMFRINGNAPASDAAVGAEHRIAILKRIPIFTHLTYNELVKVLGLTQLVRTRANTMLIAEGQAGEEFFVVLAGEVDVLKSDRVITTLKAGVHLGEMAMIDNAPRSASVRAKTDCNLLVMRREEFFGLIRGEPVIASKLLWSFVQELSGRLRETNEALEGARQSKDPQGDFEIFVDEDET